MAWGLPPKFELKQHFQGAKIEELHNKTTRALESCDFSIKENSLYLISIEKRMKLSFLSFFTFSRAYMEGIILITESGEVTVKTRYDYQNTRTSGGLMNDLGRQKIEITALLKAIEGMR